MPIEHPTTAASDNLSSLESDAMSDIQLLTQQVQEVGASAGRWAVAGQWLTLMAAVSALLLWWTSTVALKKTNALAGLQDKLAKAKDDRLAGELKDKDLKIADTEAVAALAHKSAGDANAVAGDANARAALLEQETAEAKLALESRKEENLQLSLKLEEEQIRRAKLVEAVLWRNGRLNISDWWRAKFDANVKSAVSRFGYDRSKMPEAPLIKYSIVCAQELEPMWVASELAHSLFFANFQLTSISFEDDLRPGIVIERTVGPADESDFRYDAADAIVAGLRDNFVTATTCPPMDTEAFPPNTLRISVGPSDRLTGPRVWQQVGKDGSNKLHELPMPVRLHGEDGKVSEIAFPKPKSPKARSVDNSAAK